MKRPRTGLFIICTVFFVCVVGCAKPEESAPASAQPKPTDAPPADKPPSVPTPPAAETSAAETPPADTPVAAAASEASTSSSKATDFGPFTLVVPQNWKSEPPANNMRLGQWIIPKVQGDPADGQIVLFHFPGSGGPVQMNLDRWCAQFVQPDGKNSKDVAEIRNDNIGGFKVTTITLGGTFQDRPMPGGPDMTERPDWYLLGAIIEADGGGYFFKATGPQNTLLAAKPNFDQFLRTLKAK